MVDGLAAADGLVNATPVGMTGEREMPLPPALLRPDLWVADIVYRPLETELLGQARAGRLPHAQRRRHGGGPGGRGVRLFTGETPDAERMSRHFTSLDRRVRADRTGSTAMRKSIATVSLSGTLEEKLPRPRRSASTAWSCSRTTSSAAR